MTAADAAALLRGAMWVALKLAGPPLGAALLVGVVVSLFQAVTQINEQTLSFVPKAVVLIVVLAVLFPFMATSLQDFMHMLAGRVAAIGTR